MNSGKVPPAANRIVNDDRAEHAEQHVSPPAQKVGQAAGDEFSDRIGQACRAKRPSPAQMRASCGSYPWSTSDAAMRFSVTEKFDRQR